MLPCLSKYFSTALNMVLCRQWNQQIFLAVWNTTSEGARGIEDRVMDREPYVFTFALPLIAPGSWVFHFLSLNVLKTRALCQPTFTQWERVQNVFERISEVRQVWR